jgi:dipeptidase D
MSDHLEDLQPAEVWNYFAEILKIPRPSKKEEKISEYVIEFAERQGLTWKKDRVGNILISKPATSGMESVKKVVLQSHLDMVGEKNSDIDHDFEKDPIDTFIENGWLTAKGTTLGADDGIGIATQLSILAADNIKHGPVECLFTIDEESGMTGAAGLDPDLLSGNILINLDSEDEGELFIGCAGGMDTVATFSYRQEAVPEDFVGLEIHLNGLIGGHSGDEIHKGLGNSNKILNQFLWESSQRYDIRIHRFDGGKMRNAIPREGSCILAISPAHRDDFVNDFYGFFTHVRSEYSKTDPNLDMKIREVKVPSTSIDPETQKGVLESIHDCPHGVVAWSKEIDGLVETSTNLASVKFTGKEKIVITTSQRSSLDTAKNDIAGKIEHLFSEAGAEVIHSDGYPGWEPKRDSEIVRITEEAYIRLFNTSPDVKAIHAGLECGLFLEKYPALDMISFGPTIKGAHSPDERIKIDTVQRFWDLLIEVLENVPEEE